MNMTLGHQTSVNNLMIFRRFCGVILLTSLLLQVVFFSSLENVFACVLLCFGWFLLSIYLSTDWCVYKFPVSSLMLWGMAVFQFLLPMPLTLLEFKPVVFNLRMPYETLTNHLLLMLTLLCAHFVYARFSEGNNFLRNILSRTYFYEQPGESVIWISAMYGVVSLFYNYFVFGVLSSDFSDRGILFYLASNMAQYAWMPIIIPFMAVQQGKYFISGRGTIIIFGYALFLGIFSISSNMRTMLYSGVISLIALTFVGMLHGWFNVRVVFNPKRVVLGSIALLIVAGPLTDLGYAMIAVRGQRAELGAGELVGQTLKVFSDESLLSEVKKRSGDENDTFGMGVFRWDEGYLNNIILNRYVNLKISDNCIFYADAVGYSSSVIRDEVGRQVFAILPNVFLNIIGYDLNKKFDSASYSMGDFLYASAINKDFVLGSFLISSMPGVGLAAFGYWYLAVVFCLFIIIFPMFDSMGRWNVELGRVEYSFLFYAFLVVVVNYFNDRHVFVFEFRYILRGYLESIVFFLFVYGVFRATRRMTV